MFKFVKNKNFITKIRMILSLFACVRSNVSLKVISEEMLELLPSPYGLYQSQKFFYKYKNGLNI